MRSLTRQKEYFPYNEPQFHWPNFYNTMGISGIERISGCQITQDHNGWVYTLRGSEYALRGIPPHRLLEKIEEFDINHARPAPVNTEIDYYRNIRQYFIIHMYPSNNKGVKHIYIKLYPRNHDTWFRLDKKDGGTWFSLDTKDGRHYTLDVLDEYIGKKYQSALAALPQPIAEAICEYL